MLPEKPFFPACMIAMNPAMNIGVVLFVVVPQRVDDRSRLLCRGRVIEINERLTVDFLLKDGEIASEPRPIYLGCRLFCGVSNHCFELQAECRLKQA